MGLAIAVMEELKRKDSIILATTHYSEIKDLPAGPRALRTGACCLIPTL